MTATVRAAVAVALAWALGAPALAQGTAPMDAAQRRLALDKLEVLGSVLYIGAHPDDENTAMLAYLSEGRLYRTAYLSLTRGDGGQNLIGTEQGAMLGVLRTEELLAARRIDGAEQYFTRAIDFGYSKSPEETLRIWGHDRILSDVVWVIRRFRPDVIITRFPTDGRGGHGHHTASAILALEAFTAAADPTRFPEQLATVQPWQARRIFWNAWRPQLENRTPDMPLLLSVDLGAYNALLGESYAEIAARARSMHKSQGFGSSSRHGRLLNYLELMGGAPPTNGDFMGGVDTTWNRVPGGAAVAAALEAARAAYEPDHPERSVPALLDAVVAMDAAGGDPWVAVKRRAALDLIRSSLGLWLDATVEDPTATAGSAVKVTATAIDRAPLPVTLERVEPDGGAPVETNVALADNVPIDRELTVAISADAAPTQPYWLVDPPDGGAYHVADQRLIGMPRTAPPVQLTFVLRVAGRELRYRVPVVYRWTDPVRGERSRPLEISPPVLLNLDRGVVLFPDASPRSLTVRVRAGAPAVAGTLALELPPGFTAVPGAQPFEIAAKGGETAVLFTVTPPVGATVGTLTAVATVAGKQCRLGIATIDYPHIPIQTVLPPAAARLVRTDVRIDGKRVGYVMGPGDDVPDALRQMGYEVELLGDETLDGGDLARFDAIVIGVRAYDTREALARDQGRLMAYVEAGGSLVVQYNTTRGLISDHLGPYPIELSHDRVTDETAPVALLVPDHPLLSTPNRITSADFDGWVQERGLYFPHTWDVHYQAPLAMADPGEPASKGALLFTTYGKGTFVYTGLSFFRQLPAGVPGAYRLFANLIAGGRGGG